MKSSVRAPGVVVLMTILSCVSGGRPGAMEIPSPPPGDYIDDYGIPYSITRTVWSQGSVTRYEIVKWDAEGRFAIARNAAGSPADAGLFTRIDWVELEGGGEYGWGFCYVVWDAATVEAARAAPQSDRATPRTGCNGFPFSRLRRAG